MLEGLVSHNEEPPLVLDSAIVISETPGAEAS